MTPRKYHIQTKDSKINFFWTKWDISFGIPVPEKYSSYSKVGQIRRKEKERVNLFLLDTQNITNDMIKIGFLIFLVR